MSTDQVDPFIAQQTAPESVFSEPAMHSPISETTQSVEGLDRSRVVNIGGEQMTLGEAIDRCPHLSKLGEQALEDTVHKSFAVADRVAERQANADSTSEAEKAAALQAAKERLAAKIKARQEAKNNDPDEKPQVKVETKSKTTKNEAKEARVEPPTSKPQIEQKLPPFNAAEPPKAEKVPAKVAASDAETQSVQPPSEVLTPIEKIATEVNVSAKIIVDKAMAATEATAPSPIIVETTAATTHAVHETIAAETSRIITNVNLEPTLQVAPSTPDTTIELTIAPAAAEDEVIYHQWREAIDTPITEPIPNPLEPFRPTAEEPDFAAMVEAWNLESDDPEIFRPLEPVENVAYVANVEVVELDDDTTATIDDVELSSVIDGWIDEYYSNATTEAVEPESKADLQPALEFTDTEPLIDPLAVDWLETSNDVEPVESLAPLAIEIDAASSPHQDDLLPIPMEQNTPTSEEKPVTVRVALEQLADAIEALQPDQQALPAAELYAVETILAEEQDLEVLVIAVSRLLNVVGLPYTAELTRSIALEMTSLHATGDYAASTTNILHKDRGTHESLQWFQSWVKAIRQQTSDRGLEIGRIVLLVSRRPVPQLQAI